MEAMKRGARFVHGVEIVPGHVEVANGFGKEGCSFEVADANEYTPTQAYDVLLFLALLHKLKNPTEAAKRISAWCLDLCVVRLPPSGPVIIDDRSEREPHDITAALVGAGFVLELITEGPYHEWMGYFRRGNRKWASVTGFMCQRPSQADLREAPCARHGHRSQQPTAMVRGLREQPEDHSRVRQSDADPAQRSRHPPVHRRQDGAPVDVESWTSREPGRVVLLAGRARLR
jgi:hypothetical protein